MSSSQDNDFYAKGSPEEFLKNLEFNYLKQPNDRDLVEEVRNIFAEALASIDPSRISFFDSEPNIVHARTLTTELQRYRLVAFLNSQYCLLEGSINHHRRFIRQDMDPDTLVGVIRSYHVPTMIQLGLPAPYGVIGTAAQESLM